MNITEYTQYILWGGGALIVLVVIHGLWMNWRGRSAARNGVEPLVREPAEQMDFDFDPHAGVIDGTVAAHPTGEPPDASASAIVDGGALEDDDPAVDSVRQGLRIPVAGRRTEPSVRRTERAVNGSDAPAQVAGPAAGPAARPGENAEEVTDVIVIWVMARDGLAFDGESLVRTFMANELRFAGNVFRKLDPNTRKTLFTVANGVEPGTFDLSDVASMMTPRVVFLLRLPSLNDPRPAFEEMLEVAQEVAVSLGGELKDERKNDLSGQTIEHCRQRIRDFKRINMRH